MLPVTKPELPPEEPSLEQSITRVSARAIFEGNRKTDVAQKTLHICGSGRGGTTAIAGIAHHLGVSMFPVTDGQSTEIYYEDMEINKAAQGKDVHDLEVETDPARITENLIGLLEARNSTNDVWGWKDPSSDLYLTDVLAICRNLHIVFVTRDLFEVADSHVQRNDLTLSTSIDITLARYNRYWVIIRDLQIPTLIASYNRVVNSTEEFIQQFSKFFDIAPTDEQICQAIEFVHGDSGYRRI